MGYRDILVTEEYIKAYFEIVKHTIPGPIEYFGYYDNSFDLGQMIDSSRDRVYTIYYSKKPYAVSTFVSFANTGKFRVSAKKIIEVLQYVEVQL